MDKNREEKKNSLSVHLTWQMILSSARHCLKQSENLFIKKLLLQGEKATLPVNQPVKPLTTGIAI